MEASSENLGAIARGLDTPTHRLLAALVGGGGTVVGVGLAGLTKLVADERLRLRWPQAVWFALEVFAVGTTGGALGHYLIVKAAPGSAERQALKVGCPIGLATAVIAWSLTYYGRAALSPFESGPESERALRSSLKLGLAAGPLAGTAVCLAVLKVLRQLGEKEARANSATFENCG